MSRQGTEGKKSAEHQRRGIFSYAVWGERWQTELIGESLLKLLDIGHNLGKGKHTNSRYKAVVRRTAVIAFSILPQ